MKEWMFGLFATLLLVTIVVRPACSEIMIWQAHAPDDPFGGDPPAYERVIDYHPPVPGDPNGDEFPPFLHPYGDHGYNPQEIHINFTYTEGYTNPTLLIQAEPSISDPNAPHSLEVFKDNIFIDTASMESPESPFHRFSIGYLQKGLLPQNTIILRCSGPEAIPLVFDTISLLVDDTDTDGDGVSDLDEGDCSTDPDTACIPVPSDDPSVVKRISLHLERQGGEPYSFTNARILDANSMMLPDPLRFSRFLPYGLIDFRIEGIIDQEPIGVLIGFEAPLFSSARLHACLDQNSAVELDAAFPDGNTALIFLNDGGPADSDGGEAGAIHAILALSYPRSLDVHIEQGGCFIEGVYRRGLHEAGR